MIYIGSESRRWCHLVCYVLTLSYADVATLGVICNSFYVNTTKLLMNDISQSVASLIILQPVPLRRDHIYYTLDQIL